MRFISWLPECPIFKSVNILVINFFYRRLNTETYLQKQEEPEKVTFG